MLTASGAPGSVHAARLPGTVIAAMAVLAALSGLELIVGLLSALTLHGLESADGGPDSAWRWVEVPPFTAAVMRLCLWHGLVAFLLRGVLVFALARGSRIARATAVAAEAVAVVVMVPMLFLAVEGSHKLGGPPSFAMLKVGAGVCVLASALVVALLCTPSARAWFDRR